jgi:hypothetical protein
MSVRTTGKVWELALPPNEKYVLLALADHADHEGEHAYPGLELMEAKTGYTQRNLRRILLSLEEKGVIIRTHRGGGLGNRDEYSINPDACPLTSYFDRKRGQDVRKDVGSKADNLSAIKRTICPQSKRAIADKSDTTKRTSETGKADKSDSSHDNERARDLTVMEPSIEPSHTARGRARECADESSGENHSRHSFEVVHEFAKEQPGIKQPLAVATRRFGDGLWDTAIDRWLAEKAQVEIASVMPGERDDELLERFLEAVETKMNRESFASWFEPIHELTREGQTMHVSAATVKARDWIKSHYGEIVNEALSEMGYEEWKMEFHCGKTKRE